MKGAAATVRTHREVMYKCTIHTLFVRPNRGAHAHAHRAVYGLVAHATLARMGTTRSDRIAALKKKKEQLSARIVRLSNLESAKERKERTRRLLLDGLVFQYLLAQADAIQEGRGPTPPAGDLRDLLLEARDTVMTRDRDRKLFDLPPRPKPASDGS